MCRICLIVVVATTVLASCSANRLLLTPYDDLTVRAATDVNPDVAGQPSPIGVRVYELSGRSTFDNLDFQDAYSNGAAQLSDQLLASAKYVLQPGEVRSERLELAEAARYVAIVAAYRDVEDAHWKLVYRIDPDWYQEHTALLGKKEVLLEQ
ncbi:MAG TPA: type VI secretion system lipoprotein TssJ [Gammaproteobacteria bacterium]|nr:type VI secretion system lipoprotein TssJ [Gammaproteobacteria bacterium]